MVEVQMVLQKMVIQEADGDTDLLIFSVPSS